jgi:hypothetical protein
MSVTAEEFREILKSEYFGIGRSYFSRSEETQLRQCVNGRCQNLDSGDGVFCWACAAVYDPKFLPNAKPVPEYCPRRIRATSKTR